MTEAVELGQKRPAEDMAQDDGAPEVKLARVEEPDAAQDAAASSNG
jgi:hypothetical protein